MSDAMTNNAALEALDDLEARAINCIEALAERGVLGSKDAKAEAHAFAATIRAALEAKGAPGEAAVPEHWRDDVMRIIEQAKDPNSEYQAGRNAVMLLRLLIVRPPNALPWGEVAAPPAAAPQEQVLQFIGWLSGDIPELHNVEVPRLHDSWLRFLAAAPSPPPAHDEWLDAATRSGQPLPAAPNEFRVQIKTADIPRREPRIYLDDAAPREGGER